jgi:hypothetical protein
LLYLSVLNFSFSTFGIFAYTIAAEYPYSENSKSETLQNSKNFEFMSAYKIFHISDFRFLG